MSWDSYLEYMQQIAAHQINTAPYNDEKYLSYTKKNLENTLQTLKNITLNAKLYNELSKLSSPLNWIVLTEPWCSDASHSAPVIASIADAATAIRLHILLRDENETIMNQYLTNGGKAIPKLICFDENFQQELFVWGPRPASLQAIVEADKTDSTLTFSDKIKKINDWYLQDQTNSLQEELLVLLKNIEK